MTAATFVLLSGGLTFGIPLLLAVLQLLLRSRRDDGDEPPPPPALPLAPKPLPDCLLPRPVVRQRHDAPRALVDA